MYMVSYAHLHDYSGYTGTIFTRKQDNSGKVTFTVVIECHYTNSGF